MTYLFETSDRECDKIFKGKNLEKGSAFPTCISVNR
jgi:methionine aminopeptidase